MIKEVILWVYLLCIKVVFAVCKLFKVKDKTTMLTSFGDNAQCVIDELNRSAVSEVIVLKEPRCTHQFKNIDDGAVIHFTSLAPLQFIKGIYHLATSSVIFVDNYHVILAACRFKKNVMCVQLWHANGAVKLFGLKDKSIQERRHSAYRRFNAVYKKFNKVVVSSEDMAGIFKAAFDKTDKDILRTGVPRTDFYYDVSKVHESFENMKNHLPHIKGKTVLLYAPTYRTGEMNLTKLDLNIEKMEKQLGESYHLFIRAHPAVQLENIDHSNFVTDVSKGYNIEDVLAATDILITDYSSTPFEFSILNRPMLFFPYDLNTYIENTGIWFDYENYVPGNIAMTTDELIHMIHMEDFHFEKVKPFNERWNKYADGHSTSRLIEILYK